LAAQRSSEGLLQVSGLSSYRIRRACTPGWAARQSGPTPLRSDERQSRPRPRVEW
jgi:hypothetical protein